MGKVEFRFNPVVGEVITASHGLKYCRCTGTAYMILTVGVVTRNGGVKMIEPVVTICLN